MLTFCIIIIAYANEHVVEESCTGGPQCMEIIGIFFMTVVDPQHHMFGLEVGWLRPYFHTI